MSKFSRNTETRQEPEVVASLQQVSLKDFETEILSSFIAGESISLEKLAEKFKSSKAALRYTLSSLLNLQFIHSKFEAGPNQTYIFKILPSGEHWLSLNNFS